MAKTRVLVDGFQFLRPAGTGIASYVRTLSTMLRSAGSEVSVLYGERYRPRGNISARAAATTIFSREPPVDRLSTMLERAAMGLGFMTGRGYRAQPVTVDTSHVDLSAIEPPLPGADEILNANRIFTRASCGFRFMGRFTGVARPIGCKLDVAHWTAPLPIRMRGVPNIYTIHDLIPLRLPHFVIGSGHHTFRLHEIIAREADHIITVSEASKRDIVELLGVPDERITVTYQPVPHLPNLDQAEAERLVENVYGIEPKQYALFLGAIEPKKNIKRLVEAFASADLGIPLLLAGPLGWLHDADLDLINVVNRARQTASIKSAVTPMQALVAMSTANALVHQLGYLPRQHVVALLRCAKFFVFPSLYEGFGLPVLEAMQLGVPVLTSNNSSLVEIAQGAAVLVNVSNQSEFTGGLRTINSDGDLRNELSRKGPARAARFSSEYCFGLLREAYAKVGVQLAHVDNASGERSSVSSDRRLAA